MLNTRAKNPENWLSILKPYFRPYYLWAAIAILLIILDALFTALRPWPLKVVIDKVINKEFVRVPFVSHWINSPQLTSMHVLYIACISMLLIALGTGIFSYLYTRLIGNISRRFIYSLRNHLFQHLQRLSLRFHTKSRLGDIMTRLTSDINSLQNLTDRGSMLFLSNFLLIVSRLSIMFWLNWEFTLIACSVLPFLIWAVWWHTAKIKYSSRLARNSDGQMASIAQETLGSISIVQGLSQETNQDKLFTSQSKKSLIQYLGVVSHQARMQPIIDLLAAFGLTLVMYFGAIGVKAGTISIGDVIVFFFYVSNFYSPIRALSRQFSNFANGVAGAERVAEILSQETVTNEDKNLKNAPSFKGEIEYREVSFKYEKDQAVLKKMSFKIKAGDHLAIVGATGAGKSTIANLLLRFFDPDAGTILIDGLDIKQFSRSSIRNQIGLILQESFLFSGTIRENLVFGCSKCPSEDRIVEAAKTALADEFISKLPMGYDTVVSERGANFSGGQKQRIAIARAIISEVPILLLDEPTSSLDTIFEAKVLQNLKKLSYHPTTIIITHSISAAKMADYVAVIDKGELIEFGKSDPVGINGIKFNEFASAESLQVS